MYGLELLDVALPTDAVEYPSLTPLVAAAAWYERTAASPKAALRLARWTI